MYIKKNDTNVAFMLFVLVDTFIIVQLIKQMF